MQICFILTVLLVTTWTSNAETTNLGSAARPNVTCGCSTDTLANRTSGRSAGQTADTIRIDDMDVDNPQNYISCHGLWSKGRMPYTFAPDYPARYREVVRSALSNLSSRTDQAVRFVELSDKSKTEEEEYFVKVIAGKTGCHSHVGMSFSEQIMSLPADCVQEVIIQHEFMHALGIGHEQSRSDRDKYVTVNWENIQGDSCDNFYKSELLIQSDFPAYDYDSVMHYASYFYACGKNGDAGSVVKKSGEFIGRISGLPVVTDLDIAKIKYLYSPRNLLFCSDQR